MSGNQTTAYHWPQQERGRGHADEEQGEEDLGTRKQPVVITVAPSHIIHMSSMSRALDSLVSLVAPVRLTFFLSCTGTKVGCTQFLCKKKIVI